MTGNDFLDHNTVGVQYQLAPDGEISENVLENCGEIDPLRLDDYRARDGYQALEQCL